MKLTIDIESAAVLISFGTDKVYLNTTLPSPYPPDVDDTPLTLVFDTRKGTGVEYCQEHLGIDPKVIHMSGAPT